MLKVYLSKELRPDEQMLENNALKMRHQLITQSTDPGRLRKWDVRLHELVGNEWEGAKSDTPSVH